MNDYLPVIFDAITLQLFFDKQIWDDFAFYTSAKLRNRIARRVELPLKLP